ncbi:MAG: spheroidene monooxygenase [Pseudomonadota bacterium]
MQVTSLSVFRFDSAAARLWAFSQMGLARRALAAEREIGFWKLFGTGGGESFRARPNFGVYAILATWPSDASAQEGLAASPVLRQYRARAAENWTVRLATVSVRGRWDGRAPFEPVEAPLEAPFAILTRASIKPWKAAAFWRGAPDIDARTAEEPAILFKRGMGEVPYLRQVTFSIWSDLEAMKQFAYRHPYHRDAARHARERAWFSEELFARFRVLGAEGTWEGADPLATCRPMPFPAPREKESAPATVSLAGIA